MAVIQEGEFSESTWDKKKIIITLLLLGFIAVGVFKYRDSLFSFIPQDTSESFVMGASAEKNPAAKDRGRASTEASKAATLESMSFQDRLMELKEEITHLNPADVAGSTPQIQKVIKDIQSLQGYPQSQAKQMCQNICKNL